MLLTTAQVCALTGFERHKVYGLIQSGEIPALKVGRDWRVRRVSLDRWAREQERMNTRRLSQ